MARTARCRVLPDKGLHAGKLAQTLRERDQAEQRRGADRQRPQGIDPAPADPDSWRDPLLRRHPVTKAYTIVRIAETGTERLG